MACERVDDAHEKACSSHDLDRLPQHFSIVPPERRSLVQLPQRPLSAGSCRDVYDLAIITWRDAPAVRKEHQSRTSAIPTEANR